MLHKIIEILTTENQVVLTYEEFGMFFLFFVLGIPLILAGIVGFFGFIMSISGK